ncbi:MAG: hypothetical protein GX677_07020 [Treponema sp.]|nr:hypothetical protein [Treponema sp.]
MNLDYQAGQSPIQARQNFSILFALLILAVIILFFTIIWFCVKKYINHTKSEEYIEKEKNRLTKFKDITKIAKKYLLSSEEQLMLWEICKLNACPNITYKMRDNNEIINLFRKTYDIFKVKKESEEKFSSLFKLLYHIEMIITQTKNMSSTRQIPLETVIFYVTKTNEQYPLTLIQNTKDSFSLDIPDFIYKTPIKPKELEKISFLFKTKDGVTYSFSTRVIRYQKTTDNVVVMVVAHSDNIFTQVQRHYKREVINDICYFSPVRINRNHVKDEDAFIYSPKKYQGKLINISGGGCCISTPFPIRENQHLRILLPSLGIDEKILGIIKRTRKLVNGEFAIHIQFIKFSIKTQNKIFAYVYKFEL